MVAINESNEFHQRIDQFVTAVKAVRVVLPVDALIVLVAIDGGDAHYGGGVTCGTNPLLHLDMLTRSLSEKLEQIRNTMKTLGPDEQKMLQEAIEEIKSKYIGSLAEFW